jgi:NADPH2 dehydrogenase
MNRRLPADSVPIDIAMTPEKITRVGALKSVDEFKNRLRDLNLDLPCDDQLGIGVESPMAKTVSGVKVNGRMIGNRWAIQPMEGWDGTTSGGVTDEMRRRWQRFGESGAKLICGGEAMAIVPGGRANPRQLIITEENHAGLAELVRICRDAHRSRFGTDDDFVIGFQLTHSGRFCRPNDNRVYEPRVAFRHPFLDKKFNVTSDAQVFSDDEIEEMIRDFVRAARIAQEAGADFVDIKHCHGYLLHEFLGARSRPGKFGGGFENRTRILREVIAGIRADGNPIGLGVRLSCFDLVPHRPDPSSSGPGKMGPGVTVDYSAHLPYFFGFGVNPEDPTQIDLSETFKFMDLCGQLGVSIFNTTAGSPYYVHHIQRPAAYPPSDGYQPPYDPLIDVNRQIQAVRLLRDRAPKGMVVVGSGYSYLQGFLPRVAQAVIRLGWVDSVGMGRMALAYPEMPADSMSRGTIDEKRVCRTFSDCTTAPRNGLISGCYPLDKFYTKRPEFQELKKIKQALTAEAK